MPPPPRNRPNPLLRSPPPPGNKMAEAALPGVSVPSPSVLAQNNKVATYTYLTRAGREQVLYTGDQEWANITLLLETAGPVAVSTSANLRPVLSGKGILLPTGQPMPFTVSRGNRLYIAAEGINRVKVVIEQPAYGAEILGGIVRGFGAITTVIQGAAALFRRA